ncbi:hypothetical protein HZA44_01190 [Candidatus Peregrinibacteria bacterium]|nr:hypothetical protein [Candidatus Peregrinibacteria bacterium]
MEKKPETSVDPFEAMQTLTGKRLKNEQKRLAEQGFTLHGHYSGGEEGMGTFVMLIAKLMAEKAEFKMIDNTSQVEIWIKPSAVENVAEETRAKVLPLVRSEG